MNAEEREKMALAVDTLTERAHAISHVIGTETKRMEMAAWRDTLESAIHAMTVEILTNAEIENKARRIRERIKLIEAEHPKEPYMAQYKEALEMGAAALLRRVTPNE